MHIEFLRRNYILIILIALSVVFHHVWLSNLAYITYGDARAYVPSTQKELLLNAFSIYNSSTNMGAIELSGGTKFIELIHGIIANLGFDYGVSFRIIYLYPIVFIAPVAIYYFSKKFLEKDVSVFLASIVFLFNTYTLILQTAGVLMLVADIFSILYLLMLVKFVTEKKNATNFIPMVFFGFLVSIYDFRIFYILTGISTLYILHSIFILQKEKKIFFYHILSILLILLLNSHWLITIFSLQQLSDNALFTRRIFGSQYFNLSSALTLFHRFWTGAEPSAFVNQPIPLYMWTIPIFVISGFINSKSKNRYFFMSLALMGIFLTKQEDAPFGFIYKVLYNNFPGFNAFREASKFYFLTALSYSILIGYFSEFIYNHKTLINIKKFMIFTFIFAIFIFNGKPLLDTSINTLFIPRYIPPEYNVFNAWYETIPDGYRTLWVPLNSKWGSYLNKKPAISLVYIDGSNKTLKDSSEFVSYPSPKNAIGNILKQKYSSELLNKSNIRYIVIPIEDNENDDNFYNDYGKNRTYYYDLIKSLSNFKEINIGTTQIIVFENLAAKPKLYTDEPAEELSYEYLAPFLYRINLESANNVAKFEFSEDYSTGWKIYKDDPTITANFNCVMLGCVHRLFTLNNVHTVHAQVFPNINRFTLDQKDTRGHYLLLYTPQLTYFIGLLISMSTSTILFGLYIFKISKR